MKKLDAQLWKARKRQHHLVNYQRVFQELVSKKEVRLFELGVLEGGSLRMWEDYFEHGIIAGLDFRESALRFRSERIKVYCGRQEDTALLDRIRTETAKDGFDIIIDDCSHFGEFSRISFWHLFQNHLKPGGIYVIEDWETGFIPTWRDGKALRPNFRNRRSSTRTLVRNLLEKLIRFGPVRAFVQRNEKWKYLPTVALFRQRFPSHSYGMVGFIKQLIDEFGVPASKIDSPTWIEKMEFNPGQIFIYKKTTTEIGGRGNGSEGLGLGNPSTQSQESLLQSASGPSREV